MPLNYRTKNRLRVGAPGEQSETPELAGSRGRWAQLETVNRTKGVDARA